MTRWAIAFLITQAIIANGASFCVGLGLRKLFHYP